MANERLEQTLLEKDIDHYPTLKDEVWWFLMRNATSRKVRILVAQYICKYLLKVEA